MTRKQRRTLLSCFLVETRSRPDYVIKEAIGDFEFNVDSPSNFDPDGSMQSDKAISSIPLPDGEVIDNEMDASSLLIIDAMCVVNMVTKTPGMTNAMHFAK